VILQTVIDNTQSLIGSMRRSRTLSSGFSMQSSMIGDEEFDFDDEIVNSRAYRRIINRHRAPKDRSPSDGGVQGNVQEEDEYPEGEPTEILAGKGSRHIAHTGQSDGAGSDRPRRQRNAAHYPAPQLSQGPYPEDEESDLSAMSRILIATELALELDPASSDSESSWIAPLRTGTRERLAPPLEQHHDPENPDQSHESSAIALSERSDVRDSAVRRLLRDVEDWKSHKPEKFGELLIWGKYNIYSRRNERKACSPRAWNQIFLY
jgi:hypothetical protein